MFTGNSPSKCMTQNIMHINTDININLIYRWFSTGIMLIAIGGGGGGGGGGGSSSR
jgi:hypothetical protein